MAASIPRGPHRGSGSFQQVTDAFLGARDCRLPRSCRPHVSNASSPGMAVCSDSMVSTRPP